MTEVDLCVTDVLIHHAPEHATRPTIGFIALDPVLLITSFRSGASSMPRMMGGSPDVGHEQHHHALDDHDHSVHDHAGQKDDERLPPDTVPLFVTPPARPIG